MTHRALAVGETLVDEFPDRRVPAGAPLHVAAHLASLGWAVSLLTRVGDDSDGRWIRDTAESHGVDTSLVETDAEVPTGTTTIAIDDREHSFRVNSPAAWEGLQGPPTLPEPDVLVVGSLPLRAEPSRSTVTRLLSDAGTRIAVDLNVRPPDFERSDLGLLLQTAWLLKVNDVEAALVAETMGSEASRWGPEWVCVTHGASGASLLNTAGGLWRVPGRSVAVVDTVGAGDAFLAGLVHGLIDGLDPASALDGADELAARTVGHQGGLPGTNDSRSSVEGS